ncbi:alpha/beta fold hydrolase [Loigolactobacillus jiayinensis]|uniref:Alpha/beta fold hydrolase n=1 Tax=Loigolactobacillus jiayinensis TaxID=2486016 RepID=A0ABW1RJ62_9LACO|nr:alpha/beta fold hydrolase [Loigolactobacillus jiayinensis]
MPTKQSIVDQKVTELAQLTPQLSRAMANTGKELNSNAIIGDRNWALNTLALLIGMGDMDDQLQVYVKAATDSGATDNEIQDVLNLASIYTGNPRAVNAARAIAPYLKQESDRLRPNVKEELINVGDHETMVWDNHAAGFPIILIHCLALDHRTWREVYPELAKTGARVIAYDIRGHGWARNAPVTKDLDQLAQDLHQLLVQLDIKQADIYGASYGGAVAQAFATAYPEATRSLALIATGLKGFPVLAQRAVAAEKDGMAAQVAESLIRWFTPETIARNPWEVRYGRECVLHISVANWAAAWRAMAAGDATETAGALKMPVLALGGQQDASAIPPIMQQLAAAYPNSKLVSLDPGTHMMPMEQPQAVAEQLTKFYQTVEQNNFQKD